MYAVANNLIIWKKKTHAPGQMIYTGVICKRNGQIMFDPYTCIWITCFWVVISFSETQPVIEGQACIFYCSLLISRAMKTEVKRLRLKGVLRDGQDTEKTCARCRQSFGFFFNKGTVCPGCQHRVCDKCRQTIAGSRWLCTLCAKQK